MLSKIFCTYMTLRKKTIDNSVKHVKKDSTRIANKFQKIQTRERKMLRIINFYKGIKHSTKIKQEKDSK